MHSSQTGVLLRLQMQGNFKPLQNEFYEQKMIKMIRTLQITFFGAERGLIYNVVIKKQETARYHEVLAELAHVCSGCGGTQEASRGPHSESLLQQCPLYALALI